MEFLNDLFLLHAAGTSASGCHFQMYLLKGLTRWYEDRARAAAGADKTGPKCYAGQKQHCLFQLSQQLLGETLAEAYSKPLQYTGNSVLRWRRTAPVRTLTETNGQQFSLHSISSSLNQFLIFLRGADRDQLPVCSDGPRAAGVPL